MAGNDSENEIAAKCPGCRGGLLVKSEHKTLLGTATEKLTCDKCGAAFTRTKNKYKLVEVIDKTSQFWRDYKEHSLTIEQWKAIADGSPVHYDPKVGGYIPYIPDKYSEFNEPKISGHIPYGTDEQNEPKISYPPIALNVGFPTPAPVINEKSPASPSNETSGSDDNELDELIGQGTELPAEVHQTNEESTREANPLKYSLTVAGRYFLNLTFDEFLDTYHLLKCVKEEKELEPKQLKSLLQAGLLRRQKGRL